MHWYAFSAWLTPAFWEFFHRQKIKENLFSDGKSRGALLARAALKRFWGSRLSGHLSQLSSHTNVNSGILPNFWDQEPPPKKKGWGGCPLFVGAFSLTSTQKIPRLLRFFTHFYTTLKLSALLSPLITQLNSPIGKIFSQFVYLNRGEVRSFSGRYCYVHQASLGCDKFGTSYTHLTIRKWVI